jgi:hypothetical protein
LLKIEKQTNCYKATFDSNYFTDKNLLLPESIFSDKGAVDEWVNLFPALKHEMDKWFVKHRKSEREFQQLVARENNYSPVSNATDYFIVDIEYNDAAINANFDMIAIKWLSNGPSRKRTDSCSLSFIEMKYADNALKGSAGLIKHLDDIKKINPTEMGLIKQDAINVFKQLRELGLIQLNENENIIEKLSNDLPEFIFLLANHDHESTILKGELLLINSLPTNVELKFATANFMGYGLWEKNIIDLNEFKNKI